MGSQEAVKIETIHIGKPGKTYQCSTQSRVLNSLR